MNKKVIWGGIGLAFVLVLSVVGWAINPITWDWTGTVESVDLGHYTDSSCNTPFGATYTSPSATDGESFTSYVRNEGTVAATLTITVGHTGNTWITATYSYAGATIATGAGVTITWTLSIQAGHEGESFTLAITIEGVKA